MATITKRELVQRVCDEHGQISRSRQRTGTRNPDREEERILTRQEIQEVIQLAVDSITEALANGDTVVIRRFGSFRVRETGAKVGRNPKRPGEEVPIPARATVKFKPASVLKEKVEPLLPQLREQGG